MLKYLWGLHGSTVIKRAVKDSWVWVAPLWRTMKNSTGKELARFGYSALRKHSYSLKRCTFCHVTTANVCEKVLRSGEIKMRILGLQAERNQRWSSLWNTRLPLWDTASATRGSFRLKDIPVPRCPSQSPDPAFGCSGFYLRVWELVRT